MKRLLPMLALFLSACSSPESETIVETVVSEVPVTVEVAEEVHVTSVVEREVTRIVEVEVTRLVKVAVTTTPPPATNTPRPTNTPTGPRTGSRQSPVALAESVPLDWGPHSLDMTVTQVIRGPEALQRIMAANSFNDPAPEGFEWLLALVEIKYRSGADVLEISDVDLAIVTDGRVIEYFDTITYSPCCVEPAFDLELLPGGEGAGWVALPVSLDDAKPALVIGGASGVFFALYATQ